MTIRGKVEGYRKRIAEHVVAMVTQIRRHLHSFPPYLRWLGCCMAEFLRQYQGCNQDQVPITLLELGGRNRKIGGTENCSYDNGMRHEIFSDLFR